MSQPRRRRRRGRRGGRGSQPQAQSNKEAVNQAGGPAAGDKSQPRSKSSRRRRGRGRSGGRQTASPKSSEDLVRALPKERPETLTAPPDGQTLEGVIGDLQSTWGVPQYPQEYRIVLKVAEEKESRGDSSNGQSQQRSSTERPAREQAPAKPGEQGPRREKAPAAPGVASSGQREKAPRKRRRRRRRGGQGGGGGGSAGDGGAPKPPPSS